MFIKCVDQISRMISNVYNIKNNISSLRENVKKKKKKRGFSETTKIKPKLHTVPDMNFMMVSHYILLSRKIFN